METERTAGDRERVRKFISITDFSSEELDHVLDRADDLAQLWHRNRMPPSLEGQRIALWFWGSGFRNRLAFEVGARAMGADVAHVPGDLGVHEPIQDIGHYLKNWFSMLIVRTKCHEHLLALARDASVPVINARTDHNHPCEIVGDLQYIRKTRGSLSGLNVVFVGEVTNLCMSWFEAAVRFPVSVLQVAPARYLHPAGMVEQLNSQALGQVSTSSDLDGAFASEIDVVYTDCWPADRSEEEIESLFRPYQIDREMVEAMGEGGIFLPCPPVRRGQEVTEAAMRSERCRNYAAKEYLLHAQNSIMEFVVRGNDV